MKKLKFILATFMSLMMAVSFTACSSDDDDPSVPSTPTVDESQYHFDLYLTVGKHGGMSSKNTTIVRSISSLDASQGVIGISGVGTELGEYSMECISKDGYYYQVPSSNDRFTKYQIKNNSIQVVQEQKFVKNTFKVRSYTHAWLDDNTLLIASADGENKKVIWTKLDVRNMTIITEGTLDLTIDQGFETITTSGVMTYRKSDNKLFYFYHSKTTVGKKSTSDKSFHVVVLNPSDMSIISNEKVPFVAEEAGSAYGELMQNFCFYDEAGNMYFAVFETVGDVEMGKLLRMQPNKTMFDADYNGYPNAEGKLLTVQYLGNGKVLAYGRNDAEGTSIDSYSHYYSILDLNKNTRTRIAVDGKELAYSGGRFSQRSVVFNGKAFFGVNTKDDTNSIIYIYDAKTGTITKGAEIEGTHFFDMIRVVKN